MHIDAHHELENLWAGIAQYEAVKAIVLTGAGDRAFCTGIDRIEATARAGSGYPLGVQVASELVRRFPDLVPVGPSKGVERVLAAMRGSGV